MTYNQEHLTGFEINADKDVVQAMSGLVVGQTVEQTPAASTRPVAFGRFVKPEMYDVFGDYDLSGVTEAEKTWMKPDNLGKHLFQPERNAKFVVGGVSLNATEHGIVARSPAKLAEKAEERSLKDKDLDDDVIATAFRSQLHALENKQEDMNTHYAKLAEQRAMIRELAREAKQPGFAHKSEARMKELISAAWLEFTTILDVAHIQRGWDDGTRARAVTAMIHYLTQGSQRTRIGHWQAMINLADGYLGARANLFLARIREVSRMQREKQADYDRRFA